MEASEQGATPEQREEGAPETDPTVSTGPATPGVPEGHDVQTRPVESATDEVPDEDERNPAREQAPVAADHQEAIIGDPGLRDEQQPLQAEGAPSHVDTPHRTSPPPPSAQSGVPLPEDRAAGVEPGPSGPHTAVDEDAEGEAPEHDASEGQSTTPPLGG